MRFSGQFSTWGGAVLLALGAVLVPAYAQAQQPKEAKPGLVLRKPASPVTLLVTARDKHGALVPDLTASEMTLTEDGRPQGIQSFTRESALPFELGLLVDTSASMMPAMESERKAADKLIDQMLPADPGSGKKDEAFLIHFDREVELLRDFTSSRDKLHTEVEGMGPTSKTRDERQGPETMGDDRDRPMQTGGSQLYDAVFLACDELMKSKDGRKALVIFSDGIDRGSKESMNDAIDAADRSGVTLYTVYLRGDQDRESPLSNSGHRGSLGGIWPGGGRYPGGGYPGGGGQPGGGGKMPKADGKRGMEQMATRTGGRYFDTRKKEDLELIYGMIGDELHGQYVLTYTPDKADEEGGYHKVALKTSRKDVTVVTRQGYYAPGGSAQ